jgi:hypothetical protein
MEVLAENGSERMKESRERRMSAEESAEEVGADSPSERTAIKAITPGQKSAP